MAEIILDKSYLDAASPKDIEWLCSQHIVLMPDVLFYELTTTKDTSRQRCFNKFPSTANPVEFIPNVGTLLRYELKTHKPCTPLYDQRERMVFTFHDGLRTGTFKFTEAQLEGRKEQEKQVEQNTKNFFRLAMIVIEAFFPRMKGTDLDTSVKKAKRQAATDIAMVRRIYESLLEHNADLKGIPVSDLAPNWAHFRWLQVRIIYSLDLVLSYAGQIPQNPSPKFWRRIEHYNLDAEYVILASLTGAFACNEKKMIDHFELICPNGLLLRRIKPPAPAGG